MTTIARSLATIAVGRARRLARAMIVGKLFRTFRVAVRALRRNAMRSALTTLGIVIGVAAVIAMIDIGQGSAVSVQQTIASMGANNLDRSARHGGQRRRELRRRIGRDAHARKTPKRSRAIARPCSPSPRIVRVRTQVVYGNRNWVPLFIYGTTPEFHDVRDWQQLDEGEPFTDRDVRNARKVCLLGRTVVRELFQGESPLGKEIRIQNVSFRVVGVLSRKGANMMGMDQDDIVLAPWTTIKYRVAGVSMQHVEPKRRRRRTPANRPSPVRRQCRSNPGPRSTPSRTCSSGSTRSRRNRSCRTRRSRCGSPTSIRSW